MQFVYHELASNATLRIENELYKYLFKVRRLGENSTIFLRNLEDDFLYEYQILSISKREALLQLVSKERKTVKTQKDLHLAWCVVDSKTIEKQLPYLNELGIEKISFVYADFSQQNFKLDFEKYKKILINSCQQCGRTSMMQFELFQSVDTFLQQYNNAYMLHFSTQHIDTYKEDIQTIIIGCEGGFSKREVALFNSNKIVGFNSNLILRSQTAAISVGAKLLI